MVIDTEYDIVMARKSVREAAVALGFGVTDVTRIVTAASELTRNIYVYAGSGIMRWHPINGNATGLELVFEDNGPGIADVSQAMQPGYTTGKGLGMGLPGSKRLMDEMDVHSEIGQGTTIRIRKWLPR
jgi:serine/threonine-protein kinase RsbT